MHLRTKRKPNIKNILRIVFSVFLVFIIMVFVFSFGSVLKKYSKEFLSKISLNKSATSTIAVANDQSWVLNTSNILYDQYGNIIFIKKAITEKEQEQGLSDTQELRFYPQDDRLSTEGMFFIFNKPQLLRFWMKDMNYNLDIIFLKDDGNGSYKVISISKNALASSYNKDNPNDSEIFSNPEDSLAKYVLEVDSGISDKIGLKIGDILKMQ